MSKVCKLLSGTPETKNVAVADKTALVRFCLAIFMTLHNGQAKHHHRNNRSRPLRRYLPHPLLLLHIPAVTDKIAPENPNIWTQFTLPGHERI